MAEFAAEVYQNDYLPTGADTVDAVITVTAVDTTTTAQAHNAQVEIIVIDTSGSMRLDNGAKMRGAIAGTFAALEALDDGVEFAVIAGTHVARQVYPQVGLAVANRQTISDAKVLVTQAEPDGGTAMGTWLAAATGLCASRPGSIRHCILLSDGKNEHESREDLDKAIAAAKGVFQCDVRGLGTDWDVEELRHISSELLGTVDIIPEPDAMEEEFRQLTQRAMTKGVADVALRLWSPKGATIEFLKQVSPDIEDLTPKAEPVNALTRDFPLGAWANGESRDYHLQVRVPVGNVGDERLAARVMLSLDAEEMPVALVRAIWTDDEALSTRINREVAHYTGQAELAGAIQEGLAARQAGDQESATFKLGQAVKLAHEAGNEGTIKLLSRVVDVDDPETGTVRLKRQVAEADEMTLDVRSTRTVRVPRS